jgi:protein-tyrosine-phosphatase
MSNKPTVLILCTGNSCRSHIAEGILRQAAGDFIDVQSAGSKPAGYVHPKAIEVMREIGIDISGHRSKHLEEFLGQNKIETVITVCGNADQACPMFPGQVNRYLTILPKRKEEMMKSTSNFVACGIKSSRSSRPMPLVCVKAQSEMRRSSQPDRPVEKAPGRSPCVMKKD